MTTSEFKKGIGLNSRGGEIRERSKVRTRDLDARVVRLRSYAASGGTDGLP